MGNMKNIITPFIISLLVFILANPAFAQSEASQQSPFFQFIPIILIIGLILLTIKIFNKYNKKPYGPLSNTPYEPRPWVRHWARIFDFMIFSILFAFIVAFILPELFNLSELLYLLLVSFLYVFVESFMLSQWGTTPGKELLNISIAKESGDTNFTYSESLKRSLKVWAYGWGCGIPIITLITELVSYKRLMRDKKPSWDSEERFVISHGKIGNIRIFIYVLITLFMIILSRFEEFAAIVNKN